LIRGKETNPPTHLNIMSVSGGSDRQMEALVRHVR